MNKEEIKIITLGDIFKNIETEEKAFKFLNYIKELQKKAELGEHYKHLYSEVKKQKDDVVEYIKNYDVFKEFSFPLMKKWEENQVKSSIDYQFKESIKKDLLRMLGEIDEYQEKEKDI